MAALPAPPTHTRKPPDVAVLIVDDHPGVRSALEALIDRAPGLRVVGSASCGVTAIEAVVRLRPMVVVMDLHLPGVDGVAATREIRQRQAPPAVVVFSGSRELWRAAQAAGAARTVLKDEDPSMLLAAIRAVARA